MRDTEARQPLNAGGPMGPGGESPPTPRVEPETAREHAVNALTSLAYFREANGGDWYTVLNGPVKIGSLAQLLEAVEARLTLATRQ